MGKSLLAAVIVILVVAGAAYFLYSDTAHAPTTDTSKPSELEAYTYSNATADMITVDEPQAHASVPPTFTVSGKARGTWYFEATFPIEVKDTRGAVIGQGHAQAKSDWMTTEFVPYSASITLSRPYTGDARLFLEKDNPSGDRLRDASLSFPITIEKSYY